MKMRFLSKIFGNAKNAERHQICNYAEKSMEDVNYGLGFNDVNFSDRVLRLQIEPSKKSVTCLEVETLNVCSLMLAAKSPFFHKLFKNDMKESMKKAEFIIRINASEKAAFMDLLNSIYDRPLTASTRDELMGVMMAADKFEVTSCARQCVQLLIKSHMTIDSALVYLKFPSILFGDVSHVTLPLVDAAKQHLASHFIDFTKSQQDEAMSLPLCGIEAVVGSVDFQVKSQDYLLDFLLKWARKHYPDLEERRDILTNRLLGLICLPRLSYSKLMDVVEYNDFDSAKIAKLVLKVLSYKIELPHGPNSMPTINEAALLPNNALSKCVFPKHAYNNRRVVFFDIKKQDCIDMPAIYPPIYSELFYLGERRFSLFARWCKKEGTSNKSLGLFVKNEGGGSCCVAFEFSAMKKPSYEFEKLCSSDATTFTDTGLSKSWGRVDLFDMPWRRLMEDDNNCYIIDGVMHIRAQFTTNNINDGRSQVG